MFDACVCTQSCVWHLLTVAQLRVCQRLAVPRSKWETPADQIIERAGSAADSPRKVNALCQRSFTPWNTVLPDDMSLIYFGNLVERSRLSHSSSHTIELEHVLQGVVSGTTSPLSQISPMGSGLLAGSGGSLPGTRAHSGFAPAPPPPSEASQRVRFQALGR